MEIRKARKDNAQQCEELFFIQQTGGARRKSQITCANLSGCSNESKCPASEKITICEFGIKSANFFLTPAFSLSEELIHLSLTDHSV